MADSEENTRTLMELTSMNFDEAKQFLVAKGTLQAAIDAYFNETANEVAVVIPDEMDPSHPDYVRPPIAPRRDVVMLPEDDNFRRRVVTGRRNTRQALCPMRNFAREAELQEEMLLGDGAEGSSRPKRSKLEDVFRPPTDLIFSGTFQMTKEYAKNENSWLLVNLQDNTEFACQVLNRDVWSHQPLKTIIKKYFIFYQTFIDCIEGNKIRSFYNVAEFPYVAILDPRTGEEKISYRGPFTFTADEFCRELLRFLDNNFTPDYVDSGKTPTKFQLPEPVASPSKDVDTTNIISLTEEEQLEIAIKKSMQEAGIVIDSEDSEEFDSDADESEKKEEAVTDSNILPEDEEHVPGPITKLMLRLPNGKNEVIERSSKSSIAALIKFLLRNYKEVLGAGTCRVNCPAIRKDLCDMDKNLSLEDANLHPSAVLHISTED